jgi:hypothetical protein
MELWSLEPDDRVRWLAFSTLVLTAIVAGCERDDPPAVDTNVPPQTFITQGPDLSPDPRNPVNLFYRAHLFWRGEDADGKVEGFRIAVDDTFEASHWTYTTSTDSIFRFRVAEIGPMEHLFLIRAVDNLGKQDPTPDTLRFEAFTSSPPTVDLVEIIADMPTLGRRESLGIGDTVEVFSDVTWIWTGDDEDGEVVSWTSQFDSDEPVAHVRSDTTRTVGSLAAGPHTLTVTAIDDAGAVSRDPGRFTVVSNFDPKTVLDRSSVVAKLPRPWVSNDDTLEVRDIVGDPEAPPDTIPLGSTISMCWSSTDIDPPGLPDRFQYFFTSQVQGQVRAPDTCASPTDPLALSSVLGSPGGVFLVRGIDIYNNVEGHPDTLRLFINFRPEVWWVTSDTTVTTGLARFEFDGDDQDSDPAGLEFDWNIDGQVVIDPVPLPPGQRFADFFFESQDVGVHEIVVNSFDPAGSDLPSAPATLVVTVVPSGRAAP